MTTGQEIYDQIIKELDKQKIKRKDAAYKVAKSESGYSIDMHRMRLYNQTTLKTLISFANSINKELLVTFVDREQE
ncbi:MAG: hypothetical protein EHM12_08155 [Dehalococcoidia bacterium]|nr:MAG: hypothetical protein EHM12_08155 [Dehalococcoidia bacterium]